VANAGFAFDRWTENSGTVSSSPNYSFIVNGDRTLVANFVTSYSISTRAWPAWAANTSGDGNYRGGASVTISATPVEGFEFGSWNDQWGWFSSAAVTTFPADMDHDFTAYVVPAPRAAIFDLDNAPAHTPLPIDLSDNGLSVHLSATGAGFSIQPADTMGFTPAGFGGLCTYPNSVFPADLTVDFSNRVTHFSVLYSPQELACDDSAHMRATAFAGGAQVGTQVATAAVPGTWPTQRLAITVAGGFDRVVVHYDARPPTCQDWGPIFLADNMVAVMAACGSADFNGDGDVGTDQDIEAFFACLAGNCCTTCGAADFNGDGDVGTDQDIEAFFRVLAGGTC
jgi:hypothetical protein